jgi:site-specific DNA-cytosine methylase
MSIRLEPTHKNRNPHYYTKMGLIVLSLFDGISCGQQTLKQLGIQVNTYYASEVEPHAIRLTKHNFPNTNELGDVQKVQGVHCKDGAYTAV